MIKTAKNKYNLALIAKNPETVKKIIQLAQQFSNIADQYILSENSHPHVTLYHFEEDKDVIPELWKNIKKTWRENPIQLVFNKFSFISYKSIFWISLMPDQCRRLHAMHQQISHLLKLPIKNDFDPHMTLLNTKNSQSEKMIELIDKTYQPISDDFVLSLGQRDNIGQFTKIIDTV